MQSTSSALLWLSFSLRGIFEDFFAWHGLSKAKDMIQGLYKVSFSASGSSGDGVVVIENGQFVGGDSCLYYFGTFQEQGDVVTVTLNTHRHSDGDPSLLGEDDFTATLTGTVSASGFIISSGPLVIVGVLLMNEF